MDVAEKKYLKNAQPNNVYLLGLVSNRNFARENYLKFLESVAEPAKHLTQELQAKSLELGKIIADRNRQIQHNEFNVNALEDR